MRWCLIATVVLFLCTAAVIYASREIFPASDQIAFETNVNGNWDIYLLDVRTALVRNLTNNPADDLSPSWSPNGREIIFYSDRNGDHSAELHIMNMDTLKLRLFTEERGDYRRAVWSPDGHEVAYTIGYGQLQLANTDGTLRRPLGYGFSPTWSPDGRWILYYADSLDSLNAEIYALDTSATVLLNLSRNVAHDWSPAWSPDGNSVAFVTSRDGNAELYLMENLCLVVTASCDFSLRRLTYDVSNDSSPAWSPDGKTLVYESQHSQNYDLYLIDLDTLRSTPLLITPANERYPAWRPK
jgi:TolB protein